MNKKKRIFYYLLYGNGGGSDHSLLNLVKYLDKNKFEPYVYAQMDSFFTAELERYGAVVIHGKKNNNNGSPKEINGVQTLKRKTTWIRETAFFYYLYSTPKMLLGALPKVFELHKILRKYKIDIVHLNNSLSSNRSALLAGLFAGRTVVSHYRGLVKAEKVDVLLSKFVKKIICISEFVKEQYVSYGIRPDKCVVIHNGVDTNLFEPHKNGYDGKLTIANMGRLEEWKGQHIFLKAAAGLIKNHINLRFMIIGSGSREKALKDLAEELNIKEFVEFKGFVEDVPCLLKDIDILVHSAIEPEPFGRVIIEGMAAGIPVIATDVGGPKEIIEDGKDGFLV